MKRSNSLNMNSRCTSPDRNIKRKLNHSTTTKQQHEKNIIKNHDVCDACGDVGQFVCCDACPKSFHFTCVEPPMDFNDIENLKDTWYCTECQYKKDKSKAPRSNPRGLFQKLIDDVSTKNPKSYRLPDTIIHFFEGVSIDKQGKYIDTTQIKKRGKNGQIEQHDYHQLKDKSGRFFLCYYCRKTALKKPLISCDYCSLHWHLDCLKPPLAAPPHTLKKWRCPNHIENIIKPPRIQKNPMVLKEKSPHCAYQNYLHSIVDDNEIENKLIFKKSTSSTTLKSPAAVVVSENIIAKKDGSSYRLPVKSFQIDFSNYAKRIIKSRKYHNRRNSIPSTLTSSSSSEVNTPPTTFTSPITPHHPENNKNEEENWLHTMACFRAGKKILIQELQPNKTDNLLDLIKTATAPSTTTTTSMVKVNANTYQRYQKIESLLRQKPTQELLTMLK